MSIDCRTINVTRKKFDDPIQTFFLLSTGLSTIFIKLGIVSSDYESQYLHYFRHYVEFIRVKNVLLHYSMDRTEIHHRSLQNAFQRSNKHEDTIQFILREQVILATFQAMVFNFQAAGDDVGDELEIEEPMDIEDGNYSNVEGVDAIFRKMVFRKRIVIL